MESIVCCMSRAAERATSTRLLAGLRKAGAAEIGEGANDSETLDATQSAGRPHADEPHVDSNCLCTQGEHALLHASCNLAAAEACLKTLHAAQHKYMLPTEIKYVQDGVPDACGVTQVCRTVASMV